MKVTKVTREIWIRPFFDLLSGASLQLRVKQEAENPVRDSIFYYLGVLGIEMVTLTLWAKSRGTSVQYCPLALEVLILTVTTATRNGVGPFLQCAFCVEIRVNNDPRVTHLF